MKGDIKMKTFKTIITTMFFTIMVIASLFIIKFGVFNVDTHTDTYTTYKNGLLCEVEKDVRIDKVSLDLDMNQEFTIFNR